MIIYFAISEGGDIDNSPYFKLKLNYIPPSLAKFTYYDSLAFGPYFKNLTYCKSNLHLLFYTLLNFFKHPKNINEIDFYNGPSKIIVKVYGKT